MDAKRAVVGASALSWARLRALRRRGVMQDLGSIQERLARDSFAFVPGRDVWALLCERGARAEDLASLSALWALAVPQCGAAGRRVPGY